MEALINRVHNIVDQCWSSFSAKVGGELLVLNKEASMQLNFAYLLKNAMDLVIYHKGESVGIELETSIKVNNHHRNCDIVINIQKDGERVFLPIEMKYYKEYASSGGKRGALDIFVKDVYFDLELLESYSKLNAYLNGIQLTMTDLKRVIYPSNKDGKYWTYDISNGAKIKAGTNYTTPIGGHNIDITLNKNYKFDWKNVGRFYFVKLEGKNYGL